MQTIDHGLRVDAKNHSGAARADLLGAPHQLDGRKSHTLTDLREQIARSNADVVEMPVSNLDFEADGLCYDQGFLRVDEMAFRRLCGLVKAPPSYLERHSPELRAAVLAAHARLGDFGRRPVIVARGESLLTIVRGHLVNLSELEVIDGVTDILGPESDRLVLSKIVSDVDRLEVELVSPAKATEVRVGDIIHGGLSIVHSRYGEKATVIQSFIKRLVCQNGMTQRECPTINGIGRTRRVPITRPGGRETQLNQIRLLTRQAWNSLEARLEAVKDTSDQPVRVRELLENWLLRARLSGQLRRLLAAWREDGAEDTLFGAMNAVTRVATHERELSERQRRILTELAGLLAFREVHVCPRCNSILAGSIRGSLPVIA
jgi:hypothetical protein